MVILEKKVEGAAATELNRFVRAAQSLAGVSGEVNVLITSSRRVQELNRRFRRKDKPTDVLSFPRAEGGDIAISAEIARDNARRYGHPSIVELKILVLHGMLHLAGYDHERDNGRMAAREARLRAQLRLPAALIERASANGAEPSRTKSRTSHTSARNTVKRIRAARQRRRRP
ncbi:MAG TPA: rRNA maturation RNase YbeY [Candidatus Angelobacter sp.]|nr:rRNA maturation RNase YbeY [Candidatus Angelobacter sp.]